MAVCEPEDGYREGLVDYISRKERERFEVFGFSKEEEYLKKEEEKHFDFLLFGKNFFQKTKGYKEKEKCIYLSDGTLPEKEIEAEVLFKYQAADNLLRGIHNYLGSTLKNLEEKCTVSVKKEMITIYSPWNHRMKTPFALAAAEELAGKKSVLYLHFGICTGFCKSLGISKGMDMGDLFYLLKEGEEEFLSKLKSSIYSVGGFDIIPPPENPEHYLEWTKEEMEQFWNLLLEKTEYEVLVLDMGCFIPGFFETLERSSRIWLIKEHRNQKDVGIEEVHILLGKRNAALERRVEDVFLPSGQAFREDGRYQVEEFYLGEAGKCARAMLGEEEFNGNRTDTPKHFRRDGFV